MGRPATKVRRAALIAALALGLIALLALARPARAGTYVAVQCHPDYDLAAANAVFSRTSDHYVPAAACAGSGQGLQITNNADATKDGRYGAWSWYPPAGTEFTHITSEAHVSHDSGHKGLVTIIDAAGNVHWRWPAEGSWQPVEWSAGSSAVAYTAWLQCYGAGGNCGRSGAAALPRPPPLVHAGGPLGADPVAGRLAVRAGPAARAPERPARGQPTSAAASGAGACWSTAPPPPRPRPAATSSPGARRAASPPVRRAPPTPSRSTPKPRPSATGPTRSPPASPTSAGPRTRSATRARSASTTPAAARATRRRPRSRPRSRTAAPSPPRPRTAASRSGAPSAAAAAPASPTPPSASSPSR